MAIDRDIMRRRDVPMPSPGRQGEMMPRRFSVPPQQIPKGREFSFLMIKFSLLMTQYRK